jgi:hypothetical protein
MVPISASLYSTLVVIHIMAATVTFGAIFTYPIAFSVVTRHDPRSLPTMHRIEYTIERFVLIPGLLTIIVAGAYASSLGRHWGEFYVRWGLAAAIAIGALVGSVMIPGAERAAALAQRDAAAAAETAKGAQGALALSSEYRRLARRLLITGLLLGGLALVTILIMVVQLKP